MYYSNEIIYYNDCFRFHMQRILGYTEQFIIPETNLYVL
jgi:hypothetical protein